MSRRTFYDVLGINANADASGIRKAYLRASLQHHPDKNLDDVEGAKARFVEIGQAYATLSDSALRSQYDKELKSGQFRSSGSGDGNYGNSASSSSYRQNPNENADSYDNYRDFFDSTVSGMSEAELAACMGTVAVIASVVGSMVGSKLAGGRGIMGTMGSLAGSMVASQLAQESVVAIQQSSRLRLEYKEDCQRAVERGQPIPEKPRNKWEEKLKESWSSAKNQVNTQQQKQQQQARNSNSNSTSRDEQQQSRSSGETKINMGDLWRQAAAGVKAAAELTKNTTAASRR
jgi:curved DNA-binding protein CbpA